MSLRVRAGREPSALLYEQTRPRIGEGILGVLRECAQKEERLTAGGYRVRRNRDEGPALLVQGQRGERALPLGTQEPARSRSGILALGRDTRLALLGRLRRSWLRCGVHGGRHLTRSPSQSQRHNGAPLFGSSPRIALHPQ